MSNQIKPNSAKQNTEVHEPLVNQPILFLDDQQIAQQSGLARQMGAPVKWAGGPVLKPERPWEGRCVSIWGSVLWDKSDGLYKMWYEAYDPIDPRPNYRLCYATSRDGIDWDRPSLGLVEYRGSRDNNILYVGKKEIDSATVALDPFDPPEDQRFKMMLWDQELGGFVRFASPDGIQWRNLGLVKLSGPVGDRNTLMANTAQGEWTLYYRENHRGRTICMATSKDFDRWTEHGEMLAADGYHKGRQAHQEGRQTEHGEMLAPNREDAPETELYAMIGFREEGVGLGFLEMFHVLERRLDTQLVRLDDRGRPTRYMQGTPFLTRGEFGEWDSTWVCPGSCPPVRFGEELQIFYTGRRTLHWSDPPRGLGHRGAIGMACLRTHGWVMLRAVEPTATLTTVPMRVVGRRLCINADARGGEVRAELLDADSRPIEGFGALECHPLRSDATYFRLNWSGQSNLASLEARPLRLRLHLTGAKLYSIWFENNMP